MLVKVAGNYSALAKHLAEEYDKVPHPWVAQGELYIEAAFSLLLGDLLHSSERAYRAGTGCHCGATAFFAILVLLL